MGPIPAIAAGVTTACIGGVIRDIISGVLSTLMRNEIYVTASLLAAIIFVTLTTAGLGAPWPSAIGFVFGFALRGIAIRWHLALPLHRGH
ncbi:trimeric intracellular cation channel family protein [Croceicoccus estronivorus]|uniref:trimeric intracellular cation channel family protein n=1 Tax=Croceicoccus estronivorus TaxID=1172626 RepID=UPI0009EED1A9|nr:TRIC cation channel family protein [Croceicoccus estronivorus]